MAEIEQMVATLLASAEVDAAAVGGELSLVDSGVSSFSIMRFVMDLEERLEVEFTEGQIQELVNSPVSELVEVIEQAVSQP